MDNKMLRPSKKLFILLLGPGVVWYVFSVIVPLLGSLRYSFYSFKGMRLDKFVGLANYKELITDSIFWHSFMNNMIITVLCIIGQIGIALIFASFLNTRFVHFKNFHRGVMFFPAVLSTVIVGFIWTMLYNNDYGLINFALRALKLDFMILPWLDDPKYVVTFLSIPIIWQYIGYYMIIIMAGMSSIDRSVLEMAEIDGVNGWTKLTKITIPLIKNTLMVCLILCISGNMQAFEHIYVMTGGGPGTSSTVMAMYAYSKSFTQGRIDYGNAISVGILVLSLALIYIIKKVTGGSKNEQQ